MRNSMYSMYNMTHTFQSTQKKIVIMTQMSVKEGIRNFNDKGNVALLKELNQLHQQPALLPKNTLHMIKGRKHSDY